MKNIILSFVVLLCATASIAQEAMSKQYINTSQVVGVYNLGRYSAALSNEGGRLMDNMQLYTLHFLDDKVKTQEIAVPLGSKVFDVESSADNSFMIFNGRNQVTVAVLSDTKSPEYISIETGENFSFYPISNSEIDQNGNVVLIRNYAENGFDEKGRQIVIERGTEYILISAQGEVKAKRLEKYDSEKPYYLVNIFPTDGGMVYLMEYNGRKKSEYDLKLVICDNNGSTTGVYKLTNEQTFFSFRYHKRQR